MNRSPKKKNNQGKPINILFAETNEQKQHKSFKIAIESQFC